MIRQRPPAEPCAPGGQKKARSLVSPGLNPPSGGGGDNGWKAVQRVLCSTPLRASLSPHCCTAICLWRARDREPTPIFHRAALTAPEQGMRTMECTINWMPGTGMGFVAETGSGHFLTMDGASDGGGRNLAPRPIDRKSTRLNSSHVVTSRMPSSA